MSFLPAITFENIRKYPTTYILIACIFAIGTLYVSLIGSKDKQNEICEEERKQAKKEANEWQNKYHELAMAYRIQQGVMEEVKKITDSAIIKKNF